MNITSSKPTVFYKHKGMKEQIEFDAVILRICASITEL